MKKMSKKTKKSKSLKSGPMENNNYNKISRSVVLISKALLFATNQQIL